MEREKIGKNADLRAVAKLCLNSFWEKFGQRSNLKQTEIVKTREALLKLLVAPEKEVFSVLLVNDELLYVKWQNIADAVVQASNMNVVIAAYTTAQLRLKLYDYLEKVDRRVLYFDTDSCIFVCNECAKDEEYRPHLGTLLGDMTDKLKSYGLNVHIETFLSGGPKFYAYKAIDSSTGETFECCKIKGIMLNYTNSLKINFDSIKQLIDTFMNGDDAGNIKLSFKAIRRIQDMLYSVHSIKELSLPFGYKR